MMVRLALALPLGWDPCVPPTPTWPSRRRGCMITRTAGAPPNRAWQKRGIVNKAVVHSMSDAERGLVADTERDAISHLAEDDLLELHTRIRRARSKYAKNYRRAASSNVQGAGGRGKGFAQNSRDRDKAEVFELALARVSRQVAVRANEAAGELKAERLAAARQGSTGPQSTASRTAGAAPTDRGRRTRKTTGGLKKDASSQSAGARRQAKRDSR
jgi:hypothetical protein